MRLTLTENELATIVNALHGMRDACVNDAASTPDTAEGRWLRIAARESAEQYNELASQIEEADEIVVEL